jgi:LPXTG-motif cell wall-anchored protein
MVAALMMSGIFSAFIAIGLTDELFDAFDSASNSLTAAPEPTPEYASDLSEDLFEVFESVDSSLVSATNPTIAQPVSTTSTPITRRLPQTGVPNFHIPVLIGSSSVLFVAGVFLLRKKMGGDM